jgi:DNA-binding transcriptional ArsR family regulator
VATYQEALTALADPTRRSIFERLAAGPRPVVELARGLPVSRPAVSQHLRVLKGAGLVVDRQAGARRLYQLNPDGLGALRAYLDRFWDQALAAFKAAAESEQGEGT